MSKKTLHMFFGFCIMVLALCLLVMMPDGFINTLGKLVPSREPPQPFFSIQKNGIFCKSDYGTTTLTVCPGDVMLEEVALSFPQCKDHKTASDAHMSTVYVLDGNTTFALGEVIHVRIILFNGYGKRRTVGGDHLRARLINPKQQAAVNGVVIDHENGTYTAIFEALWTGKAEVIVSLAYTREKISSNYRIRKEILGTRVVSARFTTPDQEEVTLCHTFKEKLNQYPEVCNFTYENSGMPWYCGKPSNQALLCEDWTHIRTVTPELPLNDEEKILFERGPDEIPKRPSIFITRGNHGSSNDVIELPGVPCSLYNRTSLWYRRQPTGFIYKKKWHLRHCKGLSLTNVTKCLKNTTLILFGDSTTRDWYLNIRKRLNCKLVTEPWAKSKWHKPSVCIHKNTSFRAMWNPHSQPFSVGSKWDVNKYTRRSISRSLDEIDQESKVFVLIHMYMHVLAFHHNVLETKMKIIRDSVERLLERNKFARIVIKAPNTYKISNVGPLVMQDYAGYLYHNILFHIFHGLHDKIVYLDHKDITVALDTEPNHPPDDIVTAMIDAMFSYICD